jgi:hypothetical protein
LYEHIVRDYDDYVRIDEYIAGNPANWENDSTDRCAEKRCRISERYFSSLKKNVKKHTK